MKGCPVCKSPMSTFGRMVVVIDDAGRPFVFAICRRCLIRLAPVSKSRINRQLVAALGVIARRDDLYEVQGFDTLIEARIFCELETERLNRLRLENLETHSDKHAA